MYVSQAHKEICEALDRKNAERARGEEKKTGKKRFSLSSLYTTDSADGLAQKLKEIIEDKEQKTQDIIRAIDLMAELRGYKNQADFKNIRRWPQEKLDKARDEIVYPIFKRFAVVKGGRDAASA